MVTENSPFIPQSRLARITDKVLFAFICGVVVLAPVIYGSTDTIIVLNFEFAACIALALVAARQIFSGRSLQYHVIFIPFALYALYVFVQTLPILPGTNVTAIDASMLGEPARWHAISLDPNSTRASLIKLLTVGFCGLL